jgi:hypothetical protein
MKMFLYNFMKKSQERNKESEHHDGGYVDRFNVELWNSLKYFVQSKKDAILIFAGNDFFLKEFNEYMFNIINNEGMLINIELEVIKGANHIYSESAWQDNLFTVIRRWCHRFENDGYRILNKGSEI